MMGLLFAQLFKNIYHPEISKGEAPYPEVALIFKSEMQDRCIVFFTSLSHYVLQNHFQYIVHLLAIVCFYQAEFTERGNEWADRAGKRRLFAAV